MTEHDQSSDDRAEMSRRALIGGAAALGGAGFISLVGAERVAAAPSAGFPEALAPTLPGLEYISLDAFAFDVPVTGPNVGDQRRIYEPINGMQPVNRPASIFAPLPIPIGSTVRQINVAYLVQPIVSIGRRVFGTTTNEQIFGPISLVNGGGTQSLDVNVTLSHGASYYVEVFCSSGGGSIFGMTVGYVPPTQAFVPFSGAEPRVLDTREPGQGGAFAADTERVVDLSSKLVPGARSAIINLTATGTQAAGWFAVFRDGIDHPGNSSLNWFGPGQIVANNVVSAVTAGKIKVRCGPAGSHCVIDVVGSLI